jgi:hypothetical protein
MERRRLLSPSSQSWTEAGFADFKLL